MTVNNVAPTRRRQRAEPGGRGAGAAHVHLRHERPGGAGHLHPRAGLCGASGALVGTVTFNTATGDGSFDCRFADDNPTGTSSDTSTVSITVSDDDHGADRVPRTSPSTTWPRRVVVSGPSPVDEAQTLRTYTFDTSDPGVPDTFTHGPASCGASGVLVGTVTFNTASGDGSFECRFADDNPTGTSSDTSTVSITVSDDDLGSDEGSKDVTVNNVAPSVVVSGPSPVDEAQTLRTYTFDTSDPGVPDTFTHGPASCGASGVLVGTVTFNTASGDGSFECRFADDNPTGTSSDTSTVSITVSDDDLGSDEGSKDVTVNNVAPSVVVSGPSPVDEAQTLRTYTFDTSDPGVPDTFTHGPASCGASGVLVGTVTFNTASGDGSFECRFADDNPTGTSSDTSTVSITVSDDDLGSDEGSKDVTVNNVAPTVRRAGPTQRTRVRRRTTASLRTTPARTPSRLDRSHAARAEALRPALCSAPPPAQVASTARLPTTTYGNPVRYERGERGRERRRPRLGQRHRQRHRQQRRAGHHGHVGAERPGSARQLRRA